MTLNENFDAEKVHYSDAHSIFDENNKEKGYVNYYTCPSYMVDCDVAEYEDHLSENTSIDKFTIRVEVNLTSKDISVAISPTITDKEFGDEDIDWNDLFYDHLPDWVDKLLQKANDQSLTAILKKMKDDECVILRPDSAIRSAKNMKPGANTGNYRCVLWKQVSDNEHFAYRIYVNNPDVMSRISDDIYRCLPGDVLISKKNKSVSAHFVGGSTYTRQEDRWLFEDNTGKIRIPLIQKNYPTEKLPNGAFDIPTIWVSVGIDYFSGAASFDACQKRLANAPGFCPSDKWEDIVSKMWEKLSREHKYYTRIGG